MTKTKVIHLVVDSAGFIRNAPLFEIGAAIYSLPEVIGEIKDRATKERLQVLPYEICFKEPSQEDVKFVTEFSKKTGDFPCLSATDIKILALAYMLEKENVGIDHLRSEPTPKEICSTRSGSIFKAADIPGFFRPVGKDSNKIDDQQVEVVKIETKNSENSENGLNEDEQKYRSAADSDLKKDDGDEGHVDSDVDDYDDCDDDDDEKGWLNSDNIQEAIKEMGKLSIDDSPVSVACLTTDFAMQNVLIQIGLRVISIDGYIIKQAKTFILRCYGCTHTTSIMTKKFCPHCGNQTLKRVAVTINDDGTQKIHINFKKNINIRGLKYKLPHPKGGKHSHDPILQEDQGMPHNRPSSLAKAKVDALNCDYDAGSSPFAINDVYSRASQLGNRGKLQRISHRNPIVYSRKLRKHK